MGFLGSANLIGRTLFIEVAKVLSWGATGGIAAVALCGVGATTAGLQTYILGRLAQDMAGWHGEMPSHAVKSAVAKAKATFTEDVRQWREGRSAA